MSTSNLQRHAKIAHVGNKQSLYTRNWLSDIVPDSKYYCIIKLHTRSNVEISWNWKQEDKDYDNAGRHQQVWSNLPLYACDILGFCSIFFTFIVLSPATQDTGPERNRVIIFCFEKCCA